MLADRSRVRWCLNARTGETIWKRTIRTHHQDSSPTLADGRLYLLCTLGKPVVHCFEAADGKPVWSRELNGSKGTRHYGFAGSTLLWEDLVIVNVGLGAAVKKSDGAVAWEHEGASGLATPVLYHKDQKAHVMIFAGDQLVAREARSGRQVWSIPWKTDIEVNACDPIHAGGKVFLSTTYGKHAALFDVTKDPPQQLWKDRGSSFSSGFLWQDHLYCFTGHEFCCHRLATGERTWSGPGVGGGSALLAGDKIILMSGDGRLYIAPVSPKEFRPIVEAPIHGGTTWTPPSLVDGLLYVRDNRGNAICLRIAR
jgi:outer membrane protein assembly factor BamB